MEEYSCKTPVALIFFGRPDTFKQVFEKVRKAKPHKLYLIQDGPRNENDKENIAKCREIAESVDWDCEVVKDYSDTNLGCGVRPQSGISNVLKKEDRVIILEDDCIPCDSFFPYCEEMLEKYKDDERIAYVSGLNHFEEWDAGEDDYFFTKTGAIWGWATWARVWNKYYDYYVEGVNDRRTVDMLKTQIPNSYIAKSKIESWKRANLSAKNGEKLSYWDIQWGFVKYSQSMLVIVPKYNQITNIGVGATSTHATSKRNKNKFIKYKNFVFVPTKNLTFPLKHPEFCICDEKYDNLVYKCTAGNPVRRKVAKFVKKILRRKK